MNKKQILPLYNSLLENQAGVALHFTGINPFHKIVGHLTYLSQGKRSNILEVAGGSYHAKITFSRRYTLVSIYS